MKSGPTSLLSLIKLDAPNNFADQISDGASPMTWNQMQVQGLINDAWQAYCGPK